MLITVGIRPNPRDAWPRMLALGCSLSARAGWFISLFVLAQPRASQPLSGQARKLWVACQRRMNAVAVGAHTWRSLSSGMLLQASVHRRQAHRQSQQPVFRSRVGIHSTRRLVLCTGGQVSGSTSCTAFTLQRFGAFEHARGTFPEPCGRAHPVVTRQGDPRIFDLKSISSGLRSPTLPNTGDLATDRSIVWLCAEQTRFEPRVPDDGLSGGSGKGTAQYFLCAQLAPTCAFRRRDPGSVSSTAQQQARRKKTKIMTWIGGWERGK